MILHWELTMNQKEISFLENLTFIKINIMFTDYFDKSLLSYLISGEKSREQAYPATIWPVKVFFLFILNRLMAEKITILLSIDWQASHFWLGDNVTAGIECIVGSAIYFMSTGMSHSQTLRLLSSDVVTNLRFSSTKVIELTAPKCLSYSWTTSPDLMSHCKETERGPNE